ncbi:hypothetical protein PG996_004673 [Apiospora saccharicola]|uniref:NACHT domain-containing protein n=1 Tax=Apiospora saccharicola TaxID=335842 RepID=A0ABR1W4W8_9PEZI
MEATAIDQWMVDAFREAVEDFKRRLAFPDQIDLDTPQSINDIYKETAKIQALQSQTKTLRASNRLKPYLEFLAQYESAIEVFIQVKPDILALIWGPLELVLRFASNFTKAYDKILEVLGNAGQILPDLHIWASVFPANLRVQRVLCLFYQDILDLHLALLNFFGRNHLLTQIQSRMSKHKALLTEEVTLENILKARDSRQYEQDENRRIRQHEDSQLFHGFLNILKIDMYDSQVEALRKPFPATLDGWLLNNEEFKKWAHPLDKKGSSLWLQGIPGAAALKVFQSLVFQLLSEKPSLQPIIRDAHVHNHRQLSGSDRFVMELFVDLVKDLDTIYIIVDGLDEVTEDSRSFLAKFLMQTATACQNVRLLISCRNDPLLDKELANCRQKLRVDHHNEPEILAYLDSEEKLLLDQWRELGAKESALAEAKVGTNFIALHSKGMMLYAKLMMEILKALDNPDEIHDELRCLPDGLDQAYARILARIKNSPPRTSAAALKVLQWLTCASELLPLRVNEILQAMIVEKGSDDFKTTRKALCDLKQTCGPIIDVDGDQVRLVHFSTKEYIFKGHGDFLSIVDSNQEIASTILTYLSFDSFRSIFSESWNEDEVREKVKSQDFILFEYATTQWLWHMRSGCTAMTRTLPQQLIDALSKSISRWENNNYQSRNNVIAHPRYCGLDAFPRLQSMVAQAESYGRHCHVGSTEQDTKTKTYVENDPTLLARALMRFRLCLESLLCHGPKHETGCACQMLEDSYGPQLFKCDRVSCPYFHQGFATLQERDTHMPTHSRPYKCTELNCLFAQLGLQTSRDLQLHIDSQHTNHMTSSTLSTPTTKMTNISANDWSLIAIDAISRDDLGLLRTLDYSILSPYEIVRHAGKCGSKNALQIIWESRLDFSESYIGYNTIKFQNEAMTEAVLCGNIEVLDFCMTKIPMARPGDIYRSILTKAIMGGNAQVIGCFLQRGIRELDLSHERPSVFNSSSKTSGLFKLQGTQLENYIAVAERYDMPTSMRQYIFACAVYMDALPLARAFIQIGVKVNDACVPSTARCFKSMKPLEIAANKGLPDMVAFLLQNGAELDANARGNKAAIQRTEKKMGMSWTEIVEQYGI